MVKPKTVAEKPKNLFSFLTVVIIYLILSIMDIGYNEILKIYWFFSVKHVFDVK